MEKEYDPESPVSDINFSPISANRSEVATSQLHQRVDCSRIQENCTLNCKGNFEGNKFV